MEDWAGLKGRLDDKRGRSRLETFESIYLRSVRSNYHEGSSDHIIKYPLTS